jgi:pyruvate,orthophosphate dikinase
VIQVTIRLLDPPLHEFLPKGSMTEVVEILAAESGVSKEKVLQRIDSLHEVI